METRDMLDITLQSLIENLNDLKVDSKEYTMKVNDLVKLYHLKIEDDKAAWDASEKGERIKLEKEIAELKIENERFIAEKKIEHENEQQMADVGIEGFKMIATLAGGAATCIAGYVFTNHLMNKGLDFEKTGAITTTTLRTLFPKFMPNFMKK